jgi:hypothetical protein
MRRLLAAVLVTSVAACAVDEEPQTYGDGLGTPENPIPEDGLAYEVKSKIDFTVNGVVPQQVADASAVLRSFSQNPASTLLSKADQTAVQQLKSALSSTLAGSLEGWINTEIDKARIATKTMRQYASDLAAITDASLTRFTLESTLTMTPTKATHRLANLSFKPLSYDIVVLIGGMAADVLTQFPSLTVGQAGALQLGDQHFGLAFGHHAWSGIELSSTTIFGSGVQATFVTGLNCATLAKNVAARCLSSSCVGHETQLKAICDAGTTALVDQLRTRVAAVDLDVFRFIAGSARLMDDNGDGLADRIIEGNWDAEINLGLGLRKAPATFAATR